MYVCMYVLRKLIHDYIKGSGTAHHTQLHKTFTQKKRVENERQQKKATSIKQRKAILALSCLIIYILKFHPLKKHKANQRF